MMEVAQCVTTQQTIEQEDEVNLLDLLLILFKRKRLILAVTFAFPLITLIATFVISPTYQGLTQVLIPPSNSATTAMLSQLSGVASTITGGLDLGGSSTEMYVGLIQSRTVCDAVIDRFGLQDFYKNDRILGKWRSFTRDDARLELLDHLIVSGDSASGIISLSVLDKNPQKASDMANCFASELQKLLNNLAVTDAGRRRVFFQGQLKKSYEDLSNAEDAVKGFQETTGAIQIDEQAKAVLAGIAALEAQRAAKETELRVIKTFATEQNPDFKRVQEELNGLRDQLRKLEVQGVSAQPGGPVIPTGEIPNLGTEYIRKMREFKFQEALYELLLKQYTSARLDEAKETQTVQLVDVAVVPENVYSPKRLLWLAVATGLGLFVAFGVALVMGFIEKTSENPDNKARLEMISACMKKL